MLASKTNTATIATVNNVRHLEFLDALRGIAVLGVMLVHCAVLTNQKGRFFTVGFLGQRGVQLFYMISAFTLFYSMENRKVEVNATINFYIRRFFRVAPLYYLAIILNLFYQGLSPRPEAIRGLHIYEVVLGFLFLNGFSPNAINSVAIGGWSIAIEMTFYLIAPYLFSIINSYPKALLLTILSTISLIALSRFLTTLFGYQYFEYFNFFYFPIEFPVFCMGILTYMVWRQLNNIDVEKSAINKKHLSISLLVLAVVILKLSFPSTTNNLHLFCYSFVLLILAMSLYKWKLLINKFTLHLGKISYSVYLMHFFILIVIEHTFKKYATGFYEYYMGKPILLSVIFITVVVSSLLLCNITYTLIEKKGIALGQKLILKYYKKYIEV